MNKETNVGDDILKIKDDFLSASHRLSYILNNIDVLSQDHSVLHNVIDDINHLHRKYINAKIEYTEQYYKPS
jgi:hypothetical protein